MTPAETARRYLRTYVVAPRYARPHRRTLRTADGVVLAAAHLPGPMESRLSVVLVHGFANWSRSPRVHRFASVLAESAEVIVPDLRGHGRSGGLCTFGVSEPLDIAAAVAAVRPGRTVVTVGASLGGSAALLHAADHGGVDMVVALSPFAWWGRSDRPGASRVKRWTSTPAGRAVLARAVRTRVAALSSHPPGSAHPAERVHAIAPARTVIVHDPADHYFGPEHAEALAEAASEPKELWWMPGGGHGTDLMSTDLAGRIIAAVRPRLP